MNRLLGTRFNIIPGYRTVSDTFLAMDAGEADTAKMAQAATDLGKEFGVLPGEVADAIFGTAVRMRGIDQLCAARDHRLDHLAALGVFRSVVLEIKNDRGADTDDGQQLPAAGNRPRNQRRVCRE